MQLKHREDELTKPLEEDQRIIEVANFIAVFRNWFTEKNIQDFFDYWNWCHEHGIYALTREETEDAHPLDKADKSLSIVEKFAPKELNMTHDFNDFYKYLNQTLIRQYTRRVPHVGIPVSHEGKIQQTLPGEGYHIWHAEWSRDVSKRQLAWTLFLNDVDEGGELEFLHQGIRLKPRKGDFVIWPAYFTHLHRGNPPISGEKWIATGWYEQIGVDDEITFKR